MVGINTAKYQVFRPAESSGLAWLFGCVCATLKDPDERTGSDRERGCRAQALATKRGPGGSRSATLGDEMASGQGVGWRSELASEVVTSGTCVGGPVRENVPPWQGIC